jgi:hypothetical protein
MKLRYIRNLFYYDGPLSDLFIDEDGFDLYVTYPLWYGLWHRDKDPRFLYLAKKRDTGTDWGEEIYPAGWFDTSDPTNELFVIDGNEFAETKEWCERFPYWLVEARPITDEERKLWAEDTKP